VSKWNSNIPSGVITILMDKTHKRIISDLLSFDVRAKIYANVLYFIPQKKFKKSYSIQIFFLESDLMSIAFSCAGKSFRAKPLYHSLSYIFWWVPEVII